MNIRWILLVVCDICYARDPFFLPTHMEKKKDVYVLKGVCVTDNQPTAFLEYGGKNYVISVGDKVGNAHVFAITDDHVTLHMDKGEAVTISLR